MSSQRIRTTTRDLHVNPSIYPYILTHFAWCKKCCETNNFTQYIMILKLRWIQSRSMKVCNSGQFTTPYYLGFYSMSPKESMRAWNGFTYLTIGNNARFLITQQWNLGTIISKQFLVQQTIRLSRMICSVELCIFN